MPRKKKNRLIQRPPFVDGFIPEGMNIENIDPVIINFEEYEAVKLADYTGLIQVEAAKLMGVSRPTFTRIYLQARQKIATAFSELRPIKFEMGQSKTLESWVHCNSCEIYYKNEDDINESCPVCDTDENHNENKIMKHQKRNLDHACNQEGHKGNCICPKCGYKEEHKAGIPCRTMICPNCDISMIRENSDHHQRLKDIATNVKRKKIIAIPCLENNSQSEIDKHFGRCKFFALYNIEDESWSFEENPFRNLEKGSGISALEFLLEKGVFYILSREFGYKLKDIMEKSDISWKELGDEKAEKVCELIDAYKKNN
ncbi:DUF134 domain-containing protein [Bacteroidota bacterium]